VLDGEIVCLDDDGCSRFYDLLFRREWPYFLAFDVLSIDGEDLRALPLVQRKRRLTRIMPRVESRLMSLDAIPARGERLFELACERDLEGIVAKWAKGTYQCDGRGTSW
jgi:bifunctional non-homologous end joining protein LigD